MKDIFVTDGCRTVQAVPNSPKERVIAHCEADSFLAGMVEVREIPENLGLSIREGQPGALDECLRPEGDDGMHRIVHGVGYLRRIAGLDPKEARIIVGDTFYETVPESE